MVAATTSYAWRANLVEWQIGDVYFCSSSKLFKGKQRIAATKGRTWSCPPDGVYAGSVDTTLNYDTKPGGSSGIVIRDTTGGFVSARSFKIDYANDVLMVEVMATRDVLWFAEHMGMNRVLLESDSEVVIQTMVKGGFPATNSSTIIYDCNRRANKFDEVKFAHCPREANMAACFL